MMRSYSRVAGKFGNKPKVDPSPLALRSPNPPEICIPRNATLTPTSYSGVYSVASTDITLAKRLHRVV
jgi:hypothetical protein